MGNLPLEKKEKGKKVSVGAKKDMQDDGSVTASRSGRRLARKAHLVEGSARRVGAPVNQPQTTEDFKGGELMPAYFLNNISVDVRSR